MSEQRIEPSEIALLGGRKEPSCQLVALLPRRLEAGPALLYVASGESGELAHVVLTLAVDRRDLRMPVVEDIVKQQPGSLLRDSSRAILICVVDARSSRSLAVESRIGAFR